MTTQPNQLPWGTNPLPFPVDTSGVNNYSNLFITKGKNVDILGLLRELAVDDWPPYVGQSFTIYGQTLTVNSIQGGVINLLDGTDGTMVSVPYYREKLL